jgi:hypothetical protein
MNPIFRFCSPPVQGYKPGSTAARHPCWQVSPGESASAADLEWRSDPMRAWIRRWFAEATDQAIIRVVATTVGLLAYIVWGTFSYFHPGTETSVACKANCSTEFSSRHRTE